MRDAQEYVLGRQPGDVELLLEKRAPIFADEARRQRLTVLGRLMAIERLKERLTAKWVVVAALLGFAWSAILAFLSGARRRIGHRAERKLLR